MPRANPFGQWFLRVTIRSIHLYIAELSLKTLFRAPILPFIITFRSINLNSPHPKTFEHQLFFFISENQYLGLILRPSEVILIGASHLGQGLAALNNPARMRKPFEPSAIFRYEIVLRVLRTLQFQPGVLPIRAAPSGFFESAPIIAPLLK